MPEMTFTPQSLNDKSSLTDGWHPAFLMAITDEATPDTWKMYEQSPRLWRWAFLVWEVPTLIPHQKPERQTAPTSQKFSPGGKFQPSKAYVWTCELLGHQIQPGERVNLDPLMPLPCRVKVRRKDDYANIIDVERWEDGRQYLTPELLPLLTQAFSQPATAPQQPYQGPPSNGTPAAPARPPAPQTPPAQSTWGGGTVTPPAAAVKPTW